MPSEGNATVTDEPGMRVVSLADIPPGTLHDQLVQLSPEAQSTAFQILSEMQFNANDASSIRVDPSGHVFFVCTFENAGEFQENSIEEIVPDTSSEGIPEIAAAEVPISSPPIRHSRPGAQKVLYLDFNGGVVANTAWNSGSNSWDCRAYSTDSDETTFSSTEQANIIQIWERIAEDFAPFDVDVTTEEPAAWTKNTGRAMITPTTDKNDAQCPHYGYGGIAYVNVFGSSNYSYYSPAWVAEMSVANIAEATSHELGHNLGLSHDGTNSKTYYGGHAGGGISWGPIMGTGYNRNVSQWCKGEYYQASQTQDDLQIIQGKLSYRSDDHGDNDATATAMTVDPVGVISESGIIETTGDPDVFSFFTEAGTITIEVSTYRGGSSTWGANLDILLELYNSSEVLVATNNPLLDVNAGLSLEVPAGIYYLQVKPVGMGDPMASSPSGYTDYGSLGQYWITGMVAMASMVGNDDDGDGLPNDWERLYFEGPTNADAVADDDGDGCDNLSEYISGHDPTNAASFFSVTNVDVNSTNDFSFVLSWEAVSGRVYGVNWADSLTNSFINISGDLPYPAGSYTDTVERAGSQHFYQVDVRLNP